MPAKRQTLDRRSRPQVSAEAIALFRRCTDLKPRYDRCIRYDKCKSADPGSHCPECAELIVAQKRLASLCGLDWADCIGPVDVKSETVPADLRDRPLRRQAYIDAYNARVLLLAAMEAEAGNESIVPSGDDAA